MEMRGRSDGHTSGGGGTAIDLLPRYQLGYVLPVLVGDYIHYQFYRACPPDCMLLCYPLGLETFSRDGAEAALEQFWPAIDFLRGRGVDRISQGGIPISAYVGRKRMLAMVEECERRTGIPCSADFEEAIQALQAFGVRRVAVAAKWSLELMDRTAGYLADAGIETLGYVNEVHSAEQVIAINPQDGVELALDLGRRAFSEFPDAEALLLAGGAWLSLQAIPLLEAEFDRPVVTNPQATYWAALRQFGLPACRGLGRLLDSLGG